MMTALPLAEAVCETCRHWTANETRNDKGKEQPLVAGVCAKKKINPPDPDSRYFTWWDESCKQWEGV